MSAFVVNPEHITALVDAAIAWGKPHTHRGELRYFYPPITNEPGAFEEGSPWGRDVQCLVQERQVTVTEANATEIGRMLIHENIGSVSHRYRCDDAERAEYAEMEAYVWSRPSGARTNGPPLPAPILSALDCYEYQACEHPDWATSEAHVFCDALRHRAVDMLLSQYGDLPWEVAKPEDVRISKKVTR